MSRLQVLALNAAASIACSLLLFTAANARAVDREPRPFDISPQSLASALSEFARQSETEILFSPEIVAEKLSSGVRGNLLPLEALKEILEDTGLTYSTTPKGAILVQVSKTGMRQRGPAFLLADADEGGEKSEPTGAGGSQAEELEEVTVHMPEILVKGSKTLNMDIRRTKDDPLPYVVFERSMIEKSGATNIEDFLKNRLPMNTVGHTTAQGIDTLSLTRSAINLRGLGTSQTLILVDGHRASGASIGGSIYQADLNGIPLAAIERIEVLPTTASSIYGGSATGGVVNIILRRDFSGIDTQLSYGDTFDAKAASRRVGFAGGFNLEDGNTNVMFSASWSDQGRLSIADREDLVQTGNSRILETSGNDYSMLQGGFGFVQNGVGYGTPLLGATPNIMSADGTNLVLKNGTALNSRYTYIPTGYLGTSVDQGAALAANAGRQNIALANSADPLGGKGLLVSPASVESVMATVQRQFSSTIRAFVDVSASRNEGENLSTALSTSNRFGAFRIAATAPSNPFQQDILVGLPVSQGDYFVQSRTRDIRLATGITVQLPRSWLMQTDYTWDQTNYEDYTTPIFTLSNAARTVVQSGALDVLKDTNAYPVDFSPYLTNTGDSRSKNHAELKDAVLRAAGPIASLPGGEVMLSSQLAHRDEEFEAFRAYQAGSFSLSSPDRSQTTRSAYLEARLPLVSKKNRVRGIEALEVLLSARYEALEVNGAPRFVFSPSAPVTRATGKSHSIDPMMALRWQPINDLALRVSWGTGFLPPNVFQVVTTPNTSSQFADRDPRRGNTQSQLAPGQALSGGNPNLKPESSENRSVGLIFTPRFLANFRLSVDYTNIKKTDNINSFPGSGSEYISFAEQYYPDRIRRGPKLSTDPADWAGPIVFLDKTLLNLSQAEVEAYDLQLDYRLSTQTAGTFDFFSVATWQPHYQTQALSSLPITEFVGIGSGNPLKFKANGGVSWNYRNWDAQWVSRYFDSYRVDRDPLSSISLQQGNSGAVSSQIYHDVSVGYRPTMPSFFSVMKDPEVRLTVNNVFNRKPPFDVTTRTTGYSYFGSPLLANYYLTLKVSF